MKTIPAIILSFASTSILATTACQPIINDKQQNYLIGYGSLLQTQSRLRTNPRANNIFPVEVKGFERVWGIRGKHYHTTFLTVVNQPHSQLNAAYYPVTFVELKQTDHRESGYCRIQLPQQQRSPLGLKRMPKGHYWIYAQKTKVIQRPNPQYPLTQSYVDIFLDGCIEIGERYQLPGFANQCIHQTHGWPKTADRAWVNDRDHPRRPFETPNAAKIDKLLAENLKHYYQHPIEG